MLHDVTGNYILTQSTMHFMLTRLIQVATDMYFITVASTLIVIIMPMIQH